jgi:hypothetical protein
MARELSKEERDKKRAHNQEWSTAFLRENGVRYVSFDDGQKLEIAFQGKVIEFWPATGLFNSEGLMCRGVRNLVDLIEGRLEWKIYETEEIEALKKKHARRRHDRS